MWLVNSGKLLRGVSIILVEMFTRPGGAPTLGGFSHLSYFKFSSFGLATLLSLCILCVPIFSDIFVLFLQFFFSPYSPPGKITYPAGINGGNVLPSFIQLKPSRLIHFAYTFHRSWSGCCCCFSSVIIIIIATPLGKPATASASAPMVGR